MRYSRRYALRRSFLKAKRLQAMAKEPNRTTAESIRLWLTAVAIPIVLAVAGFWQFYLKEVLWPATAINLTTELSIKRAGHRAHSSRSGELEAIELMIGARNPSSNTIYLLHNYWIAWGTKIDPVQKGTENWAAGMESVINGKKKFIIGKHYNPSTSTLIAVGSAFTDDYIRPNEKITATFVFYVPERTYDLIDVLVELPTSSRGSPARQEKPALGIEYGLTSDGSLTMNSVYRVTSTGDRVPLKTDSDGNLSSRDIRYYGWQSAVSSAELSLWQDETPTPAATEEHDIPLTPDE